MHRAARIFGTRRGPRSAWYLSSVSLASRTVAALVDAPALRGRAIYGVWIFGSVARGEERPESDVDVGVLCDPPLALERAVAMDQVARAVSRDVDVIDLRTAPAALTWEILTTGRLVLERDEAQVERFVRDARYAAEDDEQRSRMVLLAQVGRVGGAER
jgi:predicted nucleotidyltransferase